MHRNYEILTIHPNGQIYQDHRRDIQFICREVSTQSKGRPRRKMNHCHSYLKNKVPAPTL
jgi:hypothetical protein